MPTDTQIAKNVIFFHIVVHILTPLDRFVLFLMNDDVYMPGSEAPPKKYKKGYFIKKISWEMCDLKMFLGPGNIYIIRATNNISSPHPGVSPTSLPR